MNYRLKSEIKMNKLNLLQIIQKDLEEIKILSEEAVEATKNPSLIIELALSKSRLLAQEIELLRDFIIQEENLLKESEEEPIDQNEDENSQLIVEDPELEIMNFEIDEDGEPEAEIDEEIPEEELELEEELEDEEIQEEETVTDEPEDEVDDEYEPTEDDEELLPEDEETKEVEPEIEDDIVEEPEDDEEEFEESDEEVEEEIETEEPEVNSELQVTQLKSDSQPGIREIHIDDLDDDDSFSPATEPVSRPVMREIPKPEEPVAPEKMVIGEKFQKERSLNDAMGETKTSESKLTNGPILSLRAAIGLNDRFLFIREIFDNNADRYNLIIDQLDKLETIQQAVDYLKSNLTLQKNETSMKFVDLLKRRFTK